MNRFSVSLTARADLREIWKRVARDKQSAALWSAVIYHRFRRPKAFGVRGGHHAWHGRQRFSFWPKLTLEPCRPNNHLTAETESIWPYGREEKR